jgi:predicted PurR-regulated permease PerM
MGPERSTSEVAYRAVLLAGALILLGLLFRQLVTLALAVLITVIFALPLSAWTSHLERRGIPRPLGALIGLLLAVAVVAGLIALIIPTFVSETNHFVDKLPTTVADLRGRIHEATGASQGEIGHRVQSFAQRYTDHPERLVGPITSLGLNVAGIVGAIVLIAITAFFMATRPEPLVNGALRAIPPPRREDALRITGRLHDAWIGWLQGTLLKMVVVGGLSYLALKLAGLDFAVLFAVVTALLIAIPYFGAAVATVLPTLFALTQSTGKALVVLVIYLLIMQFEGNVLVPLVMARTVKLHPALIAIGVVLIGELLGFLGLFVAIPILSLIVILVEELWIKPLEKDAPPAAGLTPS